MNEDFSEILNKFSNILKEKNIDLNHIVDGDNPPTHFDDAHQENEHASENSDFNLDIETILKIKEILGAIQKNSHSPRNNLLSALKPYLEDHKKEKLEQYMKIANLLTVLENFDTQNSFSFTQKNYDFVLILTLFLLLF